MNKIGALLDKAKVIHKLPSDYKLALVMGISQTSLISYRANKSLPDTRVITKICDLTGDDPMILAAQIEAERAKTTEAKTLWAGIASRLQGLELQAGFSTVSSMVTVLALSVLLAVALPVSKAYAASPLASLAGQSVYYVELLIQLIQRRTARARAKFGSLFSLEATIQNENALFQSA